ncbi:RNA polymerase sigma factor SigZ [Photobacterium sp. ZSDE20]|uniref:RNA polymerase sigma factor SigZ n=1 Tax=Photobacterium pectinilyticum TaxID=2906793 RepID=A0ABT1N865_9GAMM|nr:RNA polymerase sigma factor SigZ [Photobacterium sp. ZSDE20]MCQ1060945.1 RNA polymerase sigma factor SigZ [Photobacterium sp. ZSDE20]MDD1828834.1 RNA polymerase sigma factor SigZ [Photobacterium sp. ZSDE20]
MSEKALPESVLCIEDVWQQYQTSLKRFLQSNVSCPDDVDDLLQEILIKTYQQINTVKDKNKLKPWLFQLANNTIIDFYRKRARSKGVTKDELWYTEGDETVHHQLSHCIMPFIQALPEDDAQLLSAIELNGTSQKDYAEQHGVKYSTLKSRVKKSREKLNRLFNECCEMKVDRRGNIMGFERKDKCKKC